MSEREEFLERWHRYMASREWQVLRQAVAERSQGQCERCLCGEASEVHHLTYRRRFRERLEDLQHVCAPCHAYLSAKRPDDPVRGPIRGALLAYTQELRQRVRAEGREPRIDEVIRAIQGHVVPR
jgi:hypothetical protein